MPNFVKGSSPHPRKPLIYDPDMRNEKKCFDGEKYFMMTGKEILEHRLTKSFTSKWLPIKKEKGKTHEETYKNFVETANMVYEKSAGKIDMYKTGSLVATAVNLFFRDMNRLKITPEPIEEDEAQWILNTYQGQMVYQEPYEGGAHKYDCNAYYMSILESKSFNVPLKRGTFRKLTNDEFKQMQETFFQFGIYRVDIKDVKKHSKQMRANQDNYYTSDDLRRARDLGLEMRLYEGGYNFLHYGRGICKKGSEIFKNFVKLLWGLRKTTGETIFKLIGTLLWGGLCGDNYRTVKYNINEEFNFKVPEDTIILEEGHVMGNDDMYQIKYISGKKYFRYDWARIKPFILAKGRQEITKILRPHLDHIKQINTDGFISSKQLDVTIGGDIGELKYEGEIKRAMICNLHKVINVDELKGEDLKYVKKFLSEKAKKRLTYKEVIASIEESQ